MATVNRRDFLKALGLGGASAAAACGVVDNNRYRTPVEDLLPYVIKPEQITAGMPTYFATTIGSGPDAHPVLGVHRDGRVINVAANTRSPMANAVPKSALLELQRHYSPDRIAAPMDGDTAISWDEGRAKLVAAVKEARASGKKVAYVGPYRSGSLVELIADFTRGEAVFWEPLGREAEVRAYELLFGERALPEYRVADAEYVLSFGADFLGTWGGPQLANDFAQAKNPNIGHKIARFALLSPRMGQTGANADDWIRINPGSEAQVAFAVAKLVAAKKGYHDADAILAGVDPGAAATAAGIETTELDAIASMFADADAAVALPGGVEGANQGNTDIAIATYIINVASGNGGRTFGASGYRGPVSSTKELKALVDDMAAGNVGVLLLDDINPAYSLPALGFTEAVAKAGLAVSLSSHSDESNAACGLRLPCSDAFEDWGDEEITANTTLLRQPATSPLNDTRSLGDLLLVTAREAGLQPLAAPAPAEVEEAPKGGKATPAEGEETEAAPVALGFEPKTWREYLMSRWEKVHFAAIGAPGAAFQRFWEESLRNGFHVKSPMKSVPFTAPAITADGLAFAAPPAAPGEIHVVLYPHAHRFDGRWANQPWAQETPDPMTGQVWDSWIEVSPELAQKLGVSDNDTVRVQAGNGKLELGVEVYRGLRGMTAAIAFGQGHANLGRYADGTGVNVGELLELAFDRHGSLVLQPGQIQLDKAGGRSDLVSTMGLGDSDGGRFLGVSVNAARLAEVGDAPQDHPGELTGIHHLPRDPRLVKANKLEMYPLPDHPTYRFGMTVDTNACNGCGVCAMACAAENNLPIVGKRLIYKGREMNWIRVNRYWEGDDANPDVRFVPMMCQHCGHAPCESVCPVLATYHTIDGLNAMVYNRCVGTRYCANNCPYMARRFNFHSYVWPEPLNLQLNPDVSTRTMGVMEKCSFCVQRVRRVKDAYRDQGFTKTVPSAALAQLPACAEACPSQALTFGNLNDPESTPSKTRKSARSWILLDELNTMSAVNYLAKGSFHVAPPQHHGGGHGGDHAEGGHDGGHAGKADHGDHAGDGHGEENHDKSPAEHGGEHKPQPASHDAGAGH